MAHESRFWHFITLLTFISASVIVITCLFWTLYPYQVSDVKVPIGITNENNQIKVGEKIEMKLQVTKPNNIKPEGSVFITCNDGNLVTMASLTANLPVGEYTVLNDKYTLPPKVAVGSKCVFNFRNTYQVNPIRSINKEWQSEQFEVLSKEQ